MSTRIEKAEADSAFYSEAVDAAIAAGKGILRERDDARARLAVVESEVERLRAGIKAARLLVVKYNGPSHLYARTLRALVGDETPGTGERA